MLMSDSILDNLEVKALIADLDLVPGRASRSAYFNSQQHQDYMSNFSAEVRRELDCSLLNYYHYARLHPRKVKDNPLFQFQQLKMF